MFASLLTLVLAIPSAGPDVAVVCPPAFRESLQPWLVRRRHQGYSVVLLSNDGTEDQIRRRIRQAARPGGLRYVVLVGDADPAAGHNPLLRSRGVPTFRAEAKVNVLWGSPPHIGTDNPYADLDDDRIPDVALGRLTADSPEELSRIVAKILAYERSRDMGPWRRKIHFVAGVGGFGFFADKMLESATKYLLTEKTPAEYSTTMTYGSWQSPYCPDPRLFHLTTVERLNEGCFFWTYIGHGFPYGVARVRMPGERYPILANQDVPRLRCRHVAPIALFLACYIGAFDANHDCLAEQMLREPGAPVAVIAGSRVTMPYAMAVLSNALLYQVFHEHRATLGDILLHAKRAMMAEPKADDPHRAMLDAVAAALSPAPEDLEAERGEHLLLFNLIGDPLLRIRYPKPVPVDVTPTAVADGSVKVSGESPIAGRATIELVARRDRLTFPFPPRKDYPKDSDSLTQFQETYQRANDRRYVAVEVDVEPGPFHVALDLPPEASGSCHVCVFIQGDDDFAQGAADVEVTPRSRKNASGKKEIERPVARVHGSEGSVCDVSNPQTSQP